MSIDGEALVTTAGVLRETLKMHERGKTWRTLTICLCVVFCLAIAGSVAETLL